MTYRKWPTFLRISALKRLTYSLNTRYDLFVVTLIGNDRILLIQTWKAMWSLMMCHADKRITENRHRGRSNVIRHYLLSAASGFRPYTTVLKLIWSVCTLVTKISNTISTHVVIHQHWLFFFNSALNFAVKTSTSLGVHPRNVVKRYIPKPSRLWSNMAYKKSPACCNFGSLGHEWHGALNLTSVTSTKPALSIVSFIVCPQDMANDLPIFSPHS